MSEGRADEIESILAVAADGTTAPILTMSATGYGSEPLQAVVPVGAKPASAPVSHAPSYEADRPAFEAFARGRCLPLARQTEAPGQEYANSFTQTAREGWNAALQHVARATKT
jgi:hypothetical protein